MKINKHSLCCDSCVKFISKKSTTCAWLWVMLCENQLKFPYLQVSEKEIKNINILETLGFIKTSDSKDYVKIKVKGRKKDLMGDYFCGGNCCD